jgi:uncharacterized membrane protein YdjX (TVP38/TMEM64 family)
MYPARRHVVAGLAVAGLLLLGLVLSPGDAVARLQGLLYSPWFPLALVGLYLVRPLLAWPITALSVVVGFRYGLAIGLPVALVGAVVTSLLPYAFGRHYRDEPGPFTGLVAGSERFFDATGSLRGVIAVRLAPTPAEPVSIAAGTGRVGLPAFVAGTAIGELPWTVAAVAAGHSLSRLSLDGVTAVTPWLFVAGAAAAVALLAGPAYRWFRDHFANDATG